MWREIKEGKVERERDREGEKEREKEIKQSAVLHILRVEMNREIWKKKMKKRGYKEIE